MHTVFNCTCKDCTAKQHRAASDMKAALDALMAGFVDGSIKFTKKRWADSDPHHPANVLMCAAIEKAEEDPEPADTKSDPEIEAAVSSALAAFWDQVDRRISGCPVSRDVAMRLEAAAYDAIEAWRAENPQTAPCKYCGEPKPPAALCDCPGAIAQDLAGMRLAVQSIL